MSEWVRQVCYVTHFIEPIDKREGHAWQRTPLVTEQQKFCVHTSDLGKLQSNVGYKATTATKSASSLLSGTLTGKDDIPWDDDGCGFTGRTSHFSPCFSAPLLYGFVVRKSGTIQIICHWWLLLLGRLIRTTRFTCFDWHGHERVWY